MADAAVTSAPLVVTLEVDAEAQARFDRERSELFPAGRTQVGAHVTLFHALPGDAEAALSDDLRAAVDREAFPVRVDALMPLGRGVAYRLRSPELGAVHAALQKAWWPLLTAQDRQGFRPHVTVQNKVTPDVARSTLAALATSFAPFDVTATGVRLWRYDGGPWTFRRRFGFTPEPGRPPGR